MYGKKMTLQEFCHSTGIKPQTLIGDVFTCCGDCEDCSCEGIDCEQFADVLAEYVGRTTKYGERAIRNMFIDRYHSGLRKLLVSVSTDDEEREN
jgi:hypothetical protein